MQISFKRLFDVWVYGQYVCASDRNISASDFTLFVYPIRMSFYEIIFICVFKHSVNGTSICDHSVFVITTRDRCVNLTFICDYAVYGTSIEIYVTSF